MEVCLPTDKNKSEMTFEDRLKRDFERMQITAKVLESDMKRNPLFFMFHEAFSNVIQSQENMIRAILTNQPIQGIDSEQLVKIRADFFKEMQINYALEK